MRSKILTIVFLGVFFLGGCAVEGYRASKIRYQHRKWNDNTVRKIAARKVAPGMTGEMVKAALGLPDAISRDGDREEWGYAIQVGDYEPRKEFVYFVYFKYGVVVGTAGDRNKLTYVSWYN